jgi:predicted MFS family arabinose efflux permease
VAVLVLEVGLVLFMLFTPFWVMVLSRFLMGAASTVVWSGESIRWVLCSLLIMTQLGSP